MDEHVKGARHVTCSSGSRLWLEPPLKVIGGLSVRTDTHIGAFTEFGKGVEIQSARLSRYDEIGPGAMLGAIGHPVDWLSFSAFQYRDAVWGWHPAADAVEQRPEDVPGRKPFRGVRGEEPAVIGNDVWLGANVVVLKGVHVGDGSIVAANAVVTSDIPPYSIAGGLPARVIRPRFEADLVAELLDLRWWRFSPNQLSGVPFEDPRAAVAEIRRRVDAGLEPYDPGFVELVKPRPKAPPAPPGPRWRRAARRALGR